MAERIFARTAWSDCHLQTRKNIATSLTWTVSDALRGQGREQLLLPGLPAEGQRQGQGSQPVLEVQMQPPQKVSHGSGEDRMSDVLASYEIDRYNIQLELTTDNIVVLKFLRGENFCGAEVFAGRDFLRGGT
ncbi:hypothetical protein B0H14DRAFT_2559915 [Mycena olivaceomarginata]|nr:hypothetical protein B0H14DRAFT_2559915 [Mycena olivaceomarginata]